MNAKCVTTFSVGASGLKGGVALHTALVRIHTRAKGKKLTSVRTFFDSGSQCSFIHPDLVKDLDIEPIKFKELSVVAFGGEVQKIICPVINLKLSLGRSGMKKVRLVVTDKVHMKVFVPGLRETADELKSQGI